jgi:4-amino-4-deoxy-L-arabinose transferase-like glycosyltransferase
MNNDEGNYYRQATTLSKEGLNGYKTILHNYIDHPELHDTPTPLRILHIQFASIASDLGSGIRALSFLSLFWFAALCVLVWFFIRSFSNERTASIASSILAFSPLLNGMATRALMDSEICFFTLLALYMLMRYIRTATLSDGLLLSLILAACVLIKESFIALYPFFPLALGYAFLKEKKLKPVFILVFSLLPVCFVVLAYVVAFGNINDALRVYRIISQVDVLNPGSYTATYCSGPWYQYLIDLFLLSPVVSLLFLAFLGSYFLNWKKQTIAMHLLLCYVLWFLGSHSLLPKNVRYALSLEPIYALFAALALMQISALIPFQKWKSPALLVMLALVLIMQVRSFRHYFVEGKLYDPISYNLLEMEKVIP